MASLRPQKVVLDFNRLSFMILLSVVFYNEFLVYFKAYYSWPDVSLYYEDRKSDNLIKIMFVADPQIQGSHDSESRIIGAIKLWDSDRYLAKSFSWAIYAYKPQIIVFLGDLIDEGSECTDEEFEGYANRFKSIYYNNYATKIYVAGDNDIGGEGVDPVTEEKISRFRSHFPSNDKYTFEMVQNKLIQKITKLEENTKQPMIEIIPTNVLTFSSPDKDWFHIDTPKAENIKYRLVVSHMPILPVPHQMFAKNVMNKLQPSVIFSAHDHRGLDYSTLRKVEDAAKRPSSNVTIFTQFGGDLSDDEPQYLSLDSASNSVIHEVIVPTCSYRMGVKEMAFGLAIIDISDPNAEDNGHIFYTNLWLPARFPLLYAYIVAVSISLSLLLLGRIRKRPRRSSLGGTPRRRRSSTPAVAPAHSYSKLV